MLWRFNGSVSPPNLVVKKWNYFSFDKRQFLPLKTFNNPIKISFRELTIKILPLIKTYYKRQDFRAANIYSRFLINKRPILVVEGK
jgi:hypothetical protein